MQRLHFFFFFFKALTHFSFCLALAVPWCTHCWLNVDSHLIAEHISLCSLEFIKRPKSKHKWICHAFPRWLVAPDSTLGYKCFLSFCTINEFWDMDWWLHWRTVMQTIFYCTCLFFFFFTRYFLLLWAEKKKHIRINIHSDIAMIFFSGYLCWLLKKGYFNANFSHMPVIQESCL